MRDLGARSVNALSASCGRVQAGSLRIKAAFVFARADFISVGCIACQRPQGTKLHESYASERGRAFAASPG
jgi:hypothetical protein